MTIIELKGMYNYSNLGSWTRRSMHPIINGAWRQIYRKGQVSVKEPKGKEILVWKNREFLGARTTLVQFR